MVAEVTENNLITDRKMKQCNVTDLTSRQKHKIFADYFSEGGLVAFSKKKVGDQTYYLFTYKGYVACVSKDQ